MLKAYYDESVSLKGPDVSRLFVLGGYCAELAEWDRFEAAWKPMLEEFGIKEFHMADFESDWGEFKGWKDKCPEKRLALIERVTGAINALPCFGVMTAIDLHDLRLYMRDPSISQEALVVKAYSLAVNNCTRRFLRLVPAGVEPVPFVFDEVRKCRDAGFKSFYRVVDHLDGRERDKLHVPAWLPSIDTPPLQAADVLAYETMKEFLNQGALGAQVRDPRKSGLALLADALYWDDYFDRRNLGRLLYEDEVQQ